MSLYTSVYWTKRVLVLLVLVTFVCSGVRIYQFVTSRLSVTETYIGAIKAEAGYGKIPRISISSISGFEKFRPKRFRVTTTSGNLNAENGYPQEKSQDPVANVYRVIEQPIDLSTTQVPANIAKEMGFSVPPKELSVSKRSWEEGEKSLVIDGQYNTIQYSNRALVRYEANSVKENLTSTDQAALKGIFTRILVELKIPVALDDYVFSVEYLDYDAKSKTFVSSTASSPKFFRISAKRIYPNLSKTEKAGAFAAYPYTISNNHVIFLNGTSTTGKLFGGLVSMSLFDWPLNTKVSGQNGDIQTYYIISPSQAYEKLSNHQAYLVSAKESVTKVDITSNEIEGVDTVDLLNVRMDFYEPLELVKYIQPIYVFLVEAQNNGKKYNLVYYLPAVSDFHLI